jgi:ribonuclease P protein component
MLPKSRRLDKALFQKSLINKVILGQNSLFRFRVGKLPHIGETRFSCSISKKEITSAVKRNATRRLVYRIIAGLYPRVFPGHAVAFSLKRKVFEASHYELQKEIEAALKQTKILKPLTPNP